MPESSYIKENEEIISQLLKIPALKNLEGPDFESLLKLSNVRQYSAGDMIFGEGATARQVYYLIEGKAKIAKNDKELMILQRTGDVFGEMGAIDGSSRSASVYALTDCTCVVLDLSVLENRGDEHLFLFRYLIYRGFCEILANRLRVTTEGLVAARKEIDELKSRLS